MAVETSTPVTKGQFFDRSAELARLGALVDDAQAGVRRWLALTGHRKVGKTSLLLELSRRHADTVAMPYVDCWEVRADPLHFLCRTVRALVGAVVRRRGAEAQVGSLETGVGGRLPTKAVQGLARLGLASVDEAARIHEEIRSGAADIETIRRVFDLPGQLAAEQGEPLVVILDEFQELGRLSRLRRLGGRIDDVFGLLRSAWQQQEGVSYLVAGSRISLLRQILTEEDSAFFQHFEMVRLGPFAREDTLGMLEATSSLGVAAGRSETVSDVLDLLGDHPFYVRILVQELRGGAADGGVELPELERAVREAVEATLFDENGRLALFFEQRYRAVVGDSSTLESVLRGFADPCRITDVAKQLHVPTGAVSTAVKALLRKDALVRLPDGRYGLSDPTFALWVKRQVDFRQAMPPLLVGTESEKRVARRLSADGFSGVYQSRASRGAFDLLALHDTRVLGLQVKTTRLPYQLPRQEEARLQADAARLGLQPVLALVVSGEVRFYDLRRDAGTGRRVREDAPFAESLLALL